MEEGNGVAPRMLLSCKCGEVSTHRPFFINPLTLRTTPIPSLPIDNILPINLRPFPSFFLYLPIMKSKRTMGGGRKLFLLLQCLAAAIAGVSAKPAAFFEDFKVTWADTHVKQLQGGSAIQLILDQSSGCGFASKSKYLFGRVSMKIKLVSGDSAGTVTAFYMNSDTDNVRDELDFEFLGNRSGQPYTVQTNVFANGKGDREQRVNLWFDPSADFHTYTILWNHFHVIFSVDEVPIRVYKNNERRGVAFPNLQPMGVYSTLWEADNWATRGGLEKIDWSKAPFYAYYKDFDIEGCAFSSPAAATSCPNNAGNWWEGPAYRQLSAGQARLYRWVRLNHLIYDYCTDKSRFSLPPPECTAGI